MHDIEAFHNPITHLTNSVPTTVHPDSTPILTLMMLLASPPQPIPHIHQRTTLSRLNPSPLTTHRVLDSQSPVAIEQNRHGAFVRVRRVRGILG